MLRKFTRHTEERDHVQLVTPDGAFEERLKAVLAKSGRFHLEPVRGTIAEAETEGVANGASSLLLVDLDPLDPGELAALERVMGRRTPGLPVIAISQNLQAEAAREFLRLNVCDWFPKDGAENELLQACERALRPETLANRMTDAACYVFVPASGGVGNTTLAIQSAFLLARRKRQLRSSCLVSLDFQGGAIADYLDVPANLQLDEIAPDPDRLDEQLLEVMLSHHETGMSVLAAESSLLDYGAVPDDVVTRLLDLASTKFDNVVIDMPRAWLPWSKNVVMGADQVFIVTEMTVPGLRSARRLLDAITKVCGEETALSVLVNRHRPRLVGGGINSLRQKDAEAMLGERLAGFVYEDYRLVREAIDRGVPLYEINKGNRIDRDLSEILFAKAESKA